MTNHLFLFLEFIVYYGKMTNHLGLLHAVEENFARFVVDPGDKVEQSLVRAGGE